MTTKRILNKLMAGAAAAVMLAAAMPALAQSVSYPYSYFTGTQYFVGPAEFVSGGGYSTGPMVIEGQGQNFNPYAAYGPGTFSYNPMTGVLSSNNSYENYGYGSNYNSYGSYGYNSYGSSLTGQGGCNSYIPNNACGVISQYTQYEPNVYGY